MGDIVLLIQGGENAQRAVENIGDKVKVFDVDIDVRPNKHYFSCKIRFHPIWAEYVKYALAPEKGPSYNPAGTPYTVLEGEFPEFKELEPV
ncbi:hypothetical protein KY311_04585 [Candidatus Woesearchaeota archaeon]|nr:hypothetical protein [Candidatus Woesearchaeota archaeon]MBW3017382.1 hypothetical protein [Candidatus Woesearchaeota archaeon]